MQNRKLFKLALAAVFLGMGLVLPFLTGQIPQIGNMLLPMHLPVLFCGLLCGWQYGLSVGAVLPLLRSLLFSAPIFYPTAVAMAFELAAYGFLSGFLYAFSKRKSIFALYVSLIAAMLGGRLIWGLAQVILLGIADKGFTLHAFWAGAFLNAFPGILIQLVLIPVTMLALKKTRLVPLVSNKKRGKTP